MKLPRFFDLLQFFKEVRTGCRKNFQYFNKYKKNNMIKYYNYQKKKKKYTFSFNQLRSISLFLKSFINIKIKSFSILDNKDMKNSVNLYLLKKIQIIYYLTQTHQILRKWNTLKNKSQEKIINKKSNHRPHEKDLKMILIYFLPGSPAIDDHTIDRNRRYKHSFSTFSVILKFFKLTETNFLLSFEKLLCQREKFFFRRKQVMNKKKVIEKAKYAL